MNDNYILMKSGGDDFSNIKVLNKSQKLLFNSQRNISELNRQLYLEKV